MNFSLPHDSIDLSYLLNNQTHVKCMKLRENNYSYAAIARQLGISKSFVIKTLARYSTQTGTNCRSGNPPYGYVRANGILMKQPKEMEIILRILNLYKNQRTAYEIAVVLNHENISPRKAKHWDHSSVKKVLERYKNRFDEVEKFLQESN